MRETVNSDRISKNLKKTEELINTVFTLKLSWLKARHPELSDSEAKSRIFQGILKRKERLWMSHKEY
jgi:hypothetical protein